jgi:hypothetical protein
MKNFRLLQDELRKVKANYNFEVNDKKLLKEELNKLKDSNAAHDRKVNQLQQYIGDCEKQIIKLSSDNLEIKMNEEATRSNVGAIQKNYENRIERLNEQLTEKEQQVEIVRS